MKRSVVYYNTIQLMDRLSTKAEDYVFLGAGQFGCVFRGPFEGVRDRIIKFSRSEDKKYAHAMFLREAAIGNVLNEENLPAADLHFARTVFFCTHLGTLPVFAVAASAVPDCANEFQDPQQRHFIVIQESLGATENLAMWMNHKKKGISNDHIAKIGFQLCWAMFVASSEYGFIHCDIKPENVSVRVVSGAPETYTYVIRDKRKEHRFRITYAVGDPIVRIIDFGLSFFHTGVENNNGIFEYQQGGTPIFCGPEYYLPNEEVPTSAMDMYAVGVLMICLKAQWRWKNKKFDYQQAKQAPVLGRTYFGTEQESPLMLEMVKIVQHSPKHKFCKEFFGAAMPIDEQRLSARYVIQMILLSRALGVPHSPVYDEFVELFLRDADTSSYEKSIAALFSNKRDAVLLDFVKRMVVCDPDDRCSFGIKFSRHAFNNAIFHALFADAGFDVTTTTTPPTDTFVYEGGMALPLWAEFDIARKQATTAELLKGEQMLLPSTRPQKTVGEVRDILESIERDPRYIGGGGGYLFDVIAADLLPVIESELNKHAAVINANALLGNALVPLLGKGGKMHFPPDVAGQTRYFHWLSVAADVLHSLGGGGDVDPFQLQRCQAELPEAFLERGRRGAVMDV